MRIEKDPRKEAINLRKHGYGFGLATAVFGDPFLKIVYDRFENGEERWHGLGMVGNTVFVVVHTYPDPDDETLIRVIGLRRADRRERREIYENETFY